jgi:hypothetical protein
MFRSLPNGAERYHEAIQLTFCFLNIAVPRCAKLMIPGQVVGSRFLRHDRGLMADDMG